ncbi:MAG: hypothetical protein WCF85_12670 [Rhodospirillaceae bacterium]
MPGMLDTDDDDLEYHPPTREEVFTQLENWRRRLHALYADIISWLPADAGYETEIRDHMADEGPMRHAGVPPQPVPELVVRRNSQPVLIFTPNACWIIGAAGRIYVNEGNHKTIPHTLVDSTSPFVERGWRLIRRDRVRPALGKPIDMSKWRGLPFDRLQLLALMEPANE